MATLGCWSVWEDPQHTRWSSLRLTPRLSHHTVPRLCGIPHHIYEVIFGVILLSTIVRNDFVKRFPSPGAPRRGRFRADGGHPEEAGKLTVDFARQSAVLGGRTLRRSPLEHKLQVELALYTGEPVTYCTVSQIVGVMASWTRMDSAVARQKGGTAIRSQPRT